MKSVLKTPAAGDRLPLSELAAGVPVRLCEPPAGGTISRRLGDLGFVPGTRLAIVRRAPLGDPVEVDLRGYRLCLRLEQVQGLFVEADRPGDDS